jgi:hypothetical protein
MLIDRDYRRSKALAPYLVWDGDMPRPAFLAVDREDGEVFVATLPEGCGEPPDGLLLYPIEPCLTVRGLDQLFQHEGILEALRGVLQGDKESHTYLWELVTSSVWERFEALQPLEPWEYFEGIVPPLLPGESLEAAAERLCATALEELVYLRPLDVELFLEGDED